MEPEKINGTKPPAYCFSGVDEIVAMSGRMPTPEEWERAKPAMTDLRFEVPIIFGTSGKVDNNAKTFEELWQ